MAGNTTGKKLKIMTWGESHGPAIGAVIDGCPPGIEITEADIQKDLDRRKPGQSKVSTSRKESDKVEILSGVFNNKTTGTPIAIMIRNTDAKSSSYSNLKDIFRPGHADFTFLKKFGVRDHRGGGRSSGRETAARVASGAIAKKILKDKKVKIIASTIQVGNIKAETFDEKEIEKNPVRCADKQAAKKMEQLIIDVQKEGDSLGGIVEVTIKNCPVGLGDPVFDKIDADIAKAVISIGAVKGIEFGAGFKSATMKGSENNDQITAKGFKTNNAGGILGGISNGQDIVFRVAVKPTASISKSQNTITTKNKETKIKILGRHDPCIVPRIIPVIESMVAIVIADKFLTQQVQKS